MADLAAARAAIATALAGVAGLRGVQSEGLTPDQMNLPTCTLRPDDYSTPMNLTMSEFYEHFELVLIHSKRGGNVRAQRGLDDLYSDVVAALAAPSTPVLNIERRGYGDLEVQGVLVLGAILRLEVIDQ